MKQKHLVCLSPRLPLLDSITEPEPESEPEPATSHQFTDRYVQRTSPSAPPANAIIDDNLSPLHGLGCQDGVLKTNHKTWKLFRTMWPSFRFSPHTKTRVYYRHGVWRWTKVGCDPPTLLLHSSTIYVCQSEPSGERYLLHVCRAMTFSSIRCHWSGTGGLLAHAAVTFQPSTAFLPNGETWQSAST